MKSIFLWVGGLFGGIGLIFLAVAGFLLVSDRGFSDRAVRTSGVVVDLVRHVDHDRDRTRSSGVSYSAVVAFRTEDGRRHEFSETVRTNPPRFAVGDTVPVLYDRRQISHATVDDFWGRRGLSTIFLGMGAIFTLLGGTLLVVDLRRRRKVSRLMRNGRPIKARFLHAFRDTRHSRNGEHPFRVVAQATDPATGRLRRFESEPIWVDPSDRLAGRDLRVLIDPTDPREYHVDLSTVIDEREPA